MSVDRDRKPLSQFSDDEIRTFRRDWDRFETWFGLVVVLVLAILAVIKSGKSLPLW